MDRPGPLPYPTIFQTQNPYQQSIRLTFTQDCTQWFSWCLLYYWQKQTPQFVREFVQGIQGTRR